MLQECGDQAHALRRTQPPRHVPQRTRTVGDDTPDAHDDMVFGILQFELFIHDTESLKDKRRVVRSVKDRLHREHLVAVAEVGSQDALNVAVMGVAAVAADGRRVGKTLDAIVAKLRDLREAELGATTRRLGELGDMPPSPALDAQQRDALRQELLSMIDGEPG